MLQSDKLFQIDEDEGRFPSATYATSDISIYGPKLVDEYNVDRDSNNNICYKFFFNESLPKLREDLKCGKEINKTIDLKISQDCLKRMHLMWNYNRNHLEDQLLWILEKGKINPQKTLKEVSIAIKENKSSLKLIKENQESPNRVLN